MKPLTPLYKTSSMPSAAWSWFTNRKRADMQKAKGMAKCKWCGFIGTTAICRTHVPYCAKNPNRIKTIGNKHNKTE